MGKRYFYRDITAQEPPPPRYSKTRHVRKRAAHFSTAG